MAEDLPIRARPIMKTVTSTNLADGAVRAGDAEALPGVTAPAARRPLRELTGDRLPDDA